MTNRATHSTLSASLTSPFGYDWAVRLFGQEVVDQIPLITRGPRKGKPAAYVHWVKVVVGGWDRVRGTKVEARADRVLHELERRLAA